MPAATVRGAGRMEEIMDNLNLTTLQRGQTMVNDVAIDAFAAGFRGSPQPVKTWITTKRGRSGMR